MAHAHTERLIDTWRRSRGAARLPARTELKPEALGALLPQVFVLGENEAHGDWRFRLAGVFVNELLGRELRGSRFLEVWTPGDRAEVFGSLRRALVDGEPGVLRALASCGAGQEIGLEMTLAPATGPTQAADRMLGFVQPTGPVARLAGRPVRLLRLARRMETQPAPRLVVDNGPA